MRKNAASGCLKLKYTHKGQMEIMGLAVIVILLALGMFFVAKFSLGKPQTTQAASSQMRQTAIGFVNTLLNTDAGCGGTATFSKLLEEMAAPEYSILVCGTGTLEEHFETSVTDILSKTMDIWGYKYKLDIEYDNRAPRVGIDKLPKIIEINHECAEDMQEEAAPPFPIPTDYGDIIVIMKICY